MGRGAGGAGLPILPALAGMAGMEEFALSSWRQGTGDGCAGDDIESLVWERCVKGLWNAPTGTGVTGVKLRAAPPSCAVASGSPTSAAAAAAAAALAA